MNKKIFIFLLLGFAFDFESLPSNRLLSSQPEIVYENGWIGRNSSSRSGARRYRQRGPHFEWRKDGLYIDWNVKKYPKSRYFYKDRYRRGPKGPHFEWRGDGLYIDWEANKKRNFYRFPRKKHLKKSPHFEWRQDGLYIDWETKQEKR